MGGPRLHLYKGNHEGGSHDEPSQAAAVWPLWPLAYPHSDSEAWEEEHERAFVDTEVKLKEQLEQNLVSLFAPLGCRGTTGPPQKPKRPVRESRLQTH